MPRALWLADVLVDAGLTVKPYPGWQTRGSDDFTPRGVVLHHTVTSPNRPDSAIDRMLAETGSSKVPAPLANYSTNRDGTVSLIAAGRANHAGTGVWKGLSGNRYFFGDEMKNAGTAAEPWPAVQLESARRAAAAVLEKINADETMVCGHKEYATPAGRKTDPHSLNMNSQRALIGLLLNAKPLSGEDTMNAAQEAKLDQALALLQKMPAATWNHGGKVDETGKEIAPSAWQYQIRSYAGIVQLLGADPFDAEDVNTLAAKLNAVIPNAVVKRMAQLLDA